MIGKRVFLWLLVLLFCGCNDQSKEQVAKSENDIYDSMFRDNFFHQLSYLNDSAESLESELVHHIKGEEPHLIFWMKEGDCDSCIEQQIQFIKLIIKQNKKPVVVLADFSSKRVFASVQSSFNFIDMKLVKMPEKLSEVVGSPFYIDYTNENVSIYKPIPERASWTQRYLKTIGAL